MSGAHRLISRRHTRHQQQRLDIPRAHASCIASRRSPRPATAVTDWVLRWDLCEAVDFRIRFSTISSPLLLLPHHRWVTGTQKMVLVFLSPHSRHALTHTLSHTLMYARRHSKHSRTAHAQLSTDSPHLLVDAPQHRANGHAAHSLRSDEITSTDLGLLRHTRDTPETPSAVRSKM